MSSNMGNRPAIFWDMSGLRIYKVNIQRRRESQSTDLHADQCLCSRTTTFYFPVSFLDEFAVKLK